MDLVWGILGILGEIAAVLVTWRIYVLWRRSQPGAR
jgi:hypothetical protein